jgi:hypothetical protein
MIRFPKLGDFALSMVSQLVRWCPQGCLTPTFLFQRRFQRRFLVRLLWLQGGLKLTWLNFTIRLGSTRPLEEADIPLHSGVAFAWVKCVSLEEDFDIASYHLRPPLPLLCILLHVFITSFNSLPVHDAQRTSTVELSPYTPVK